MNHPVLTPSFCAANGIILSRFEGNSIHFGMLDTGNAVLKRRVAKTFRENQCLFQKLEADVFSLKLSQLFSEEQKNVESPQAARKDYRESIIDRVADDAPAINLLNSIFLEAISRNASDIHIESGPEETAIRYRIDGILSAAKAISPERSLAVSGRLKILANLNVLESRRPQDGHIDVKTDSYSLDVRISIVPTIWGESIVLRLLNRTNSLLNLDSLGFSSQHSVALQKIPETSSGLILVTGPTGSGKTTTLAAILKELDIKSNKIISIEDPVEYRIPGVTQIQVQEELELCFDSMLRRIFRQDPDIIMIGEIRDTETAELAIRAALTGHLVFATIHTNSAIEALYRLQNMNIPAYMVAAVLKMVIAQRLVRRLHTNFKNADRSCVNFPSGDCSQIEYRGRTVIAEIICIDAELAGLISGGASSGQLQAYLKRKEFKTLHDDADEKAARGITSKTEIKRELGSRQ